jgi:hypothetical protein
VDELGPITPPAFPPSAGVSRDGHRIKAALEYSRGPEKVWVYGALHVRDGHELTLSARSCTTAGYLRLLHAVDSANPQGDRYLIAGKVSSHTSQPIQEWLAGHPRVHQVCIPKGACWLKGQAPWWRLFGREGLAGQTLADGNEIEQAREIATQQPNRRAKAWVWGRPARTPRYRRRAFVYYL